MDQRFNGRNVWITGASEGIGLGIAKALVAEGAAVALTARDEADLERAARRLEGNVLKVPADVSDPVAMRRAAEQIRDSWKRLDGLVINAGINGTWTPLDEMEPEEWNKTIQVNLTGSFLALHYAIPMLTDSDQASVVIMSSVNGTRIFSNAGATAYAASKAGQLALGQMAALELAQRRIRVNIICPGAIDTGIHEKTQREGLEEITVPVEFPEGRIPLTSGEMGTVDDVARLTLFLLSKDAKHITGTPVWIDGAESLLQG